MAHVLVTDGEQRAALAVVRSLGRAGHRVAVASSRNRSLAGASRYCAVSLQVPDPLREPERYADAIVAHVNATQTEVLLPISETSLTSLLPRRAQMELVAVPFADVASFRHICDKSLVMEAARSIGISVPPQRVLFQPSDLNGIRSGELRFPVVVKPSRSVIEAGDHLRKLTVVHAANPAALSRAVSSLPQEAFPLLIQQRIVGPGIGVFVLLWQGSVMAAFAHRRLREKPPSGGVSVYCESEPLDERLLGRSVALLEQFHWEGVAMVEYKLDAESNEPYLMEINGRFWGSLQLAVDAGVDFPTLLVSAALGDKPARPPVYRPGVRSRWVLGDLDHLIARLRRSRAALGLMPEAPGRGRAILDFIASFRSGAGEVLRASDPAPGIQEMWDWVGRR